MRKIFTIFSTLALISMLLVACAGEETQTSVAPAGTAAMEEPTEETTEEPAGTETAAPAEEGTPVGAIPVTGEELPSRLSNQINYDVWNGNGEQIGEVNDMVVDLDNSRISHVIVGTGGFLEIGEKDIFVPWESLHLQTEFGEGFEFLDGQFAFIYQGDQEAFNNAPDFDVNDILPEPGQPADNWDADVHNYWESGVVPGTPAAEETAAPDTAAGTATPEATAATGDTGAEITEVQGVILASDLLGSDITVGTNDEVVNDQNQVQAEGTGTPQAMLDATATGDATTDDLVEVTSGNIEDAIVDVQTGNIQYLVVNAAGFADGDRLIPVPLNQFQWDANNNVFVFTDPTLLVDAPYFLDGLYPDTTLEGWNADFDGYWQ